MFSVCLFSLLVYAFLFCVCVWRTGSTSFRYQMVQVSPFFVRDLNPFYHCVIYDLEGSNNADLPVCRFSHIYLPVKYI